MRLKPMGARERIREDERREKLSQERARHECDDKQEPEQPMETLNGSTNGLHNRLNGTLAPATTSEPSEPLGDGNGERDAGGRFKAGNKCGRGNPHARKVAALRSAVLDVITPEKLSKMVTRVLEMATAGNIAAAKLIFRYAVGDPLPAADPDRLDLDEFKLIDENPTRIETARALDGLSAAAAIRLVQAALANDTPKNLYDLMATTGRFFDLLDEARRRRVEKK